MQNQQSEEEAMREMLQKIDESTSPGKWASFRDALHNASKIFISTQLFISKLLQAFIIAFLYNHK